MQPILSVFVSLQNLLLIRTSPSPGKVIFKSTLALKQWRVCTIFSAINLLHQLIHSSMNYLLISLHVSTLIYLITLFTNIHQMPNQSIQSTLQFLHFIPTIQPIFLNCFYIFLIFYATPNFYHHRWVQNIQEGRRPRTTDDPEGGPKGPTIQAGPQMWRAAPTAPAFPVQSRRGTAGATAGD